MTARKFLLNFSCVNGLVQDPNPESDADTIAAADIDTVAVTSFNTRTGDVTFTDTDLPIVATVSGIYLGTITSLEVDTYGRVVAVSATSGGVPLTDGDKGDIVVSVGGTVFTIDSAVLSTFGRTLIDDADAATARATLAAAGTGVANTFTTGTQTIQTGADATKGLVVKANSASQSANLQEWQSSAGTARCYVDKSQRFVVAAASSNTDLAPSFQLDNGRLALGSWWGGTGLLLGNNTSFAIYSIGADSTLTWTSASGSSLTQVFGIHSSEGSLLVGQANYNRSSKSSPITITVEQGGYTPWIELVHRDYNTDLGGIVFHRIVAATGSAGQIYCTADGTTSTGATMTLATSTGSSLVGRLSIDSSGVVRVLGQTAATSSSTALFVVRHNSTGTAAAGFGAGIAFQLESSTTNSQDAALIDCTWATATHASRKARVTHYVYDTAAREAFRIESDGSAAMIGFFGVSAVARASAYTQTYSTADKTHANLTASALTDSTGGTVGSTLRQCTGGGDLVTAANVDGNFATVNDQLDKLRADLTDLKQLVNAIIDDLQAYGLFQ